MKKKRKKFWRKTDWESFKFWKPDEDQYHRKRWLIGAFGFGLGLWIGMSTTYPGFCACVGLAVFGFAGAIIDAVGISKFQKNHEECYLQEALAEERATREETSPDLKKHGENETEHSEVPDNSAEPAEEDEEEQDDVLIVDEELLREVSDDGEKND